MTAKKDLLGIDGVFACTSLKPGEDWRWQTHLANIPISYEWIRGGIDLTSDATREISFSYHENFKNILISTSRIRQLTPSCSEQSR